MILKVMYQEEYSNQYFSFASSVHGGSRTLTPFTKVHAMNLDALAGEAYNQSVASIFVLYDDLAC